MSAKGVLVDEFDYRVDISEDELKSEMENLKPATVNNTGED